MVEHVIIEFVKHLEDIEQSIPDKLRVATILCVVGVVIISVGILAPISAESGVEPAVPFFLGGIVLFVGAFIFLRRAVWKLQDKRKPGIISLDLK